MKRSACQACAVLSNQAISSQRLQALVPSPEVSLTCCKKDAQAGCPTDALVPPG